ncbi:UNVERIFIED_CONTAM: hypothetical protein GTU68_061293 [Idotea baltica]|nr:hypothetical protein [Idotea baltica]
MSKKSKKKKSSAGDGGHVVCENRRARHRFEILEQIECGVMLIGSEVKSIREGNISLNESYVRFEKGDLWLIGADIAEYRQASFWNHQPKRSRKLLVRRRELDKTKSPKRSKGLKRWFPLEMYFRLVKVLVGVGRGKKEHDKRQSIKDADNKRRLNREMRDRLK